MNMHGSTLLVLCCEVPTPDPTVMGLGIMTRKIPSRTLASRDGSVAQFFYIIYVLIII